MSKKHPEHQPESEREEQESPEEKHLETNGRIPEVDTDSATDWKTKYLRALADYQNLVKQTAKERQEYIRYANSQLLEQLFPLVDQLQMAARHLKDPGLDMIIKQFQQLFTDEGLTTIAPKPGDPFDHNLHECIDTIETDHPDQDDHIAELLQSGYRWSDGAVLRPAKVKVFKLAEKPQDENA